MRLSDWRARVPVNESDAKAARAARAGTGPKSAGVSNAPGAPKASFVPKAQRASS